MIEAGGQGRGGKSYGGHDDVQTVFGQAILVAEFSPKKIQIISFRRRPPRPSTPSSSGSTQILKRRQHYTYLSTNKRRQSIIHLLVYAAISPIHKVGEIMHSFL